MDMEHIIITGASRGIGLGLTKFCLTQGNHVLGVGRKPLSAELKELSDKFPGRLQLLEIDLNDKEAPSKIAEAIYDWPCLDLLFNNAGVLITGEDRQDFEESFLTNAIVPFLLLKSLLPKLKESDYPRAIQISSLMGSITDNSSGGYYAYRSSKAALNMMIKSLSLDEPTINSILIHPGWVRTRMGGEQAPLSIETAVHGIMKVVQTVRPDQSGHFFDYTGRELSW